MRSGRIPVNRIPVRRPKRVRPVDAADRVHWKRAIELVFVETLGLAVLSLIYLLLDAQDSVLAPFLVPGLVSYVLVFATSRSVANRPLRVIVSYAIAGSAGLLIGAWPIPNVIAGVVASAVALMAMHLVGAFHAPAVAAALIAAYVDHTLATALITIPLLVALSALVVLLVWGAHRVLGDQQYPTKWW